MFMIQNFGSKPQMSWSTVIATVIMIGFLNFIKKSFILLAFFVATTTRFFSFYCVGGNYVICWIYYFFFFDCCFWSYVCVITLIFKIGKENYTCYKSNPKCPNRKFLLKSVFCRLTSTVWIAICFILWQHINFVIRNCKWNGTYYQKQRK